MKKHALLATSLLLLSCQLFAKPTPMTQQQLLKNRFSNAPIALLDVRTAEEYQAGHIKGAINIAHSEITNQLSKLDKNKPIAVYCRSGRRAGLAMEVLEKNGFKQVYHLAGDMNGWQAQELPVITSK